MTYKIIIEGNITEEERKLNKTGIPEEVKKKVTSPQPKRQEAVATRKSNVMPKVVAGVMTAYNLGMKATSTISQVVGQNYELNGDFVSARRFQNNISIGQEVLNSGMALGVGFALGGVVGIAAVGVNLAINYAFKAMDVALQNQRMIEQQRVQTYVNSQVQQRFVRNITTERLR